MAKFWRRGVSQFIFAPAVAVHTAPTTAELNAGTDLTAAIADISGWDFEASQIKTPAFSNTFTPSIPGEDTVSSPTLAVYEDKTTETMETALAKGTVGFMVFMPKGRTAGKVAEVWPVTVQSRSRAYTLGNDAARFNVKFAATDPPEQNAVCP